MIRPMTCDLLCIKDVHSLAKQLISIDSADYSTSRSVELLFECSGIGGLNSPIALRI